jgi:hypothetical protein
VRVRIGNPEHIDDLTKFLLDRGCVVERLGECELEVASLSSLRVEYAHLDVALHLQIWTKAHPGAVAELLP